jgi:hypothetical protein
MKKVSKLRSVEPEPAEPQPPMQPNLMDPQFKYIPAASTNVMQRFKALGWVPPSEKKNAGTT